MSKFDFAAADAATARYVNVDDVRELLQIALIGSERNPLRKNLVLWGPGGYGKSELTALYLEAATGIKPFVVSFNKEISSAEGFGGVDIPALQRGTLKYRVEDSWMAHEYVILEEAFDAPDSVLLALKDILTRREFTIGLHYQVQTKLIIVNTNHDPARFRSDLSKAAFLERFPYVKKVDWDNMRLVDRQAAYERIIDTVTQVNNPVGVRIKRMLAQIASAELWSPRHLTQVTEAAQDCALRETRSASAAVNMDHLRKVAEWFGFDSAEAIAVMEREELRESISKFEAGIEAILSSIRDRISALDKLPRREMSSVEKIFAELNTPDTGVMAFVDKVIDRCINARNAFGDESNAVVDRLIGELEDVRNQANMTWFNVMNNG